MFDATTGGDLSSVDVGDPASSPAVSNGVVYVSTYRGAFSTDLGKVSAFTVRTWFVSPTGNDANDCMSPSAPCATIQSAIARAVAGETIKVATGTYTAAGQEVVLIDRSLLVSGGWNASFTTQDGAAILDGQASRRGVTVTGGATATVERFVVQNGAPIFFGGGGILNGGTLMLNNSTVRSNTRGGIHNMGSLTVNESTISGNSNNSGGGGIENFLFSVLTLNNSTVSGNTSTSEGAGINNSGSVTVNNSTISANAAAFRGGGVANRITSPMTLKNTILAGNNGPFGSDCWYDNSAPITSAGHNLTGSCSYVPGPGDLFNVDPMLGPLQDNGGPTATHALLAGSPAINAGSGDCPPPATDQRGSARPHGPACDIGAYELDAAVTLPPGDFNGDGKPDILWRNESTGDDVVWFMNGTTLTGGAVLAPVGDVSWQIVGTADFNTDGRTDILWRNAANGTNLVWFMNGTVLTGGAVLVAVDDPNWRIVATGDFNADGKADIFWRNQATGNNVVWFMNGTTLSGGAVLTGVADINWKIVGVGDFNADGKPDILWRNHATGYNVVWFMDGTAITGGAVLPPVGDVNWVVGGVGDFSGDGKPDILWRNQASGYDLVWFMNGTTLAGGAVLPPVADTNWRIVGPR